ncbi:hypothetical protein E1A91_D01G269500v1 [Gossypium mustelinum]|uniref:Uncharacterized protein n=1 Tax=Gossypium mustelinum TaxID=34275 RepID=A0A5D2WC67_GOSMU|nr:hypothetical protein E1A91_1Z012100v1 [Gossypium mustelinum]TYI99179.1 hypothetical protein E1A91_D01G269500v1 [Gossypium mustelinum]
MYSNPGYKVSRPSHNVYITNALHEIYPLETSFFPARKHFQFSIDFKSNFSQKIILPEHYQKLSSKTTNLKLNYS